MLLSRILMRFSNISLRNGFQHFGAHFPHSRSYKRHGRESRTHPGSCCIRTLLKMAWRNYRNTILASTASRRSCLHLVRFCFLFTCQLIFYSKVALHPYYKLDYIRLTWGGAEEQAKEVAVRATAERRSSDGDDGDGVASRKS
jgi:hypothetical protein